MQEESEKLIDMDAVISEAILRVENSGIVFLDEIDKIAGRESRHGPDISREGVQRDILPIIEGSTVTSNTERYGRITSCSSPLARSTFQARLTHSRTTRQVSIRVELKSLNKDDFKIYSDGTEECIG